MNEEEIKLRTLTTIETFNSLDKKLSEESRLIFSRFGDIDFIMMQPESIGKTLGRSNKTLLTRSLHEEMIESFMIEDENYLKGHVSNMPYEEGMDILNLQGSHKASDKSLDKLGNTLTGHHDSYWNEDVMKKSINVLGNTQSERIFYNSCTFYMYATFKGNELRDFVVRNIKDKKKMFIGARKKENMEGLFGKIDHYVNTPEINSYSEIDSWWPKVLKNIDNVDVVLPFTGQSSRVLNKRLWNMNTDVQSIDMGSWIDTYSGIINRGWTKRAFIFLVLKQYGVSIDPEAMTDIIDKGMRSQLCTPQMAEVFHRVGYL